MKGRLEEALWTPEACRRERRFQASAAEREQAHPRSPLLRKVPRGCLPSRYLPDSGGTAPPQRGSACKCLAHLYFRLCKEKSPSCATNKLLFESFLKALPSHHCLVFTEERYFLSKRKQVLRKDLFLQQRETAGPVALAQPHIAWFRKPGSRQSCLR